MVHINTLSMALLASTVAALPHFGQHGKFPILNVTSSHGVFPTGFVAPTGTVGHPWPTGSGSPPVPTGGLFLDKRTDKAHKVDKTDKKKHQFKPSGWAQPTGTGSWPAPTGSIPGGFKQGDLGHPKQPFGVARRGFKPHWGSPAGRDTPAPTGTAPSKPHGTGVTPPHGTGSPVKGHKKSDHKKTHEKRDDDESSEKKEKKEKKEKSKSKDKKKSKSKSQKPGVAAPTGGFPAPTGSFPVPTGSFPAPAVPEGEQAKQFGAIRREAFQPHWAGAPKGKHPLPTGTSPPSPTGTGSYKPIGTGNKKHL